MQTASGKRPGPFHLSYVLRYAGMLEESARECDAGLALDPGNYQFRSCSWGFMELGKIGRRKDFIRLDAGSEWAFNSEFSFLLREGKMEEAREACNACQRSLLRSRSPGSLPPSRTAG